jgi:hypothetical protein
MQGSFPPREARRFPQTSSLHPTADSQQATTGICKKCLHLPPSKSRRITNAQSTLVMSNLIQLQTRDIRTHSPTGDPSSPWRRARTICERKGLPPLRRHPSPKRLQPRRLKWRFMKNLKWQQMRRRQIVGGGGLSLSRRYNQLGEDGGIQDLKPPPEPGIRTGSGRGIKTERSLTLTPNTMTRRRIIFSSRFYGGRNRYIEHCYPQTDGPVLRLGRSQLPEEHEDSIHNL